MAKFPMVVRKGSVRVKLYHGQTQQGYHSYYVVYYLNRVRKRVVFSDPDKAIAEAKAVADRLDKQEGVVVEIHPKDRLSYESARRYLDPIGVPVEIAAMEYAAAVGKLGKTPLSEAVDYFLKWGPSRGRKPVAEVVEEFIELKDEAQLSDHVIVAATKAKTASRRIVPISPNLRAWLAGARKEEGPVCELANMSNEIHDIVVKINERRPEPFQWKQNGLRHSWVSYRLAQTQNADQVALEAGNSRQMIFKHYRELVRPAEALEWFNITPGKVEQAGTEEKVSG